jgi:hypothetical protein
MDEDVCPRCQCCSQTWADCWQCFGEGGWAPADADPIAYAADEWETCEVCDGEGGYAVCFGSCSWDEVKQDYTHRVAFVGG